MTKRRIPRRFFNTKRNIPKAKMRSNLRGSNIQTNDPPEPPKKEVKKDNTEIVRGARLALAEAVLREMSKKNKLKKP